LSAGFLSQIQDLAQAIAPAVSAHQTAISNIVNKFNLTLGDQYVSRHWQQ
jgi:hypothetical protein